MYYISVEEPPWLFSESTSPLSSACCTPRAPRSTYIQTIRSERQASPQRRRLSPKREWLKQTMSETHSLSPHNRVRRRVLHSPTAFALAPCPRDCRGRISAQSFCAILSGDGPTLHALRGTP